MDSQPAPSPSSFPASSRPPGVILTVPFMFKSKRAPLRPTEKSQLELIPLLRDPLHMHIILRVHEFSTNAYRVLEWPQGATVEMQQDPLDPLFTALFLRFADGSHQMIASKESTLAAGELLDSIAFGLKIRWNIHLYESGRLTATPDTCWQDDIEPLLVTPQLNPEMLTALLELRGLPKELDLNPLDDGVLPFVSEETAVSLRTVFQKPPDIVSYAYRATVLETRRKMLEHLQRECSEV